MYLKQYDGNEKYIKIFENSRGWHGLLSLIFTTLDPLTCTITYTHTEAVSLYITIDEKSVLQVGLDDILNEHCGSYCQNVFHQ